MAKNFSTKDVIVQRYSDAIFKLAKEKKLASISKELDQACNIFSDEKIKNFLSSPLTSKKQLIDIIGLCKDDFSKEFTNFLFVLAESKRLGFIFAINENYKKIEQNDKNITQINVISAKKLSKDEEEEITKILGKKYKNINANYKIDESLISGIQISIGSKLIDLSVAGKLEKIQNYIKEA